MGTVGEASGPMSTVAEDVLLAVSLIPRGRVVSYGDLAALVGTSARRVGAILRDYGAAVPWWRVVNHRGDHPLIETAAAWWEAEGIELVHPGGCRIAQHRADLVRLAEAWERAKRDG